MSLYHGQSTTVLVRLFAGLSGMPILAKGSFSIDTAWAFANDRNDPIVQDNRKSNASTNLTITVDNPMKAG